MEAPTSDEQSWTCKVCGGAYAIVGSRERAGVRLKCIDCGRTEDAVLAKPQAEGWTLVDPEGKVSVATSRRELVELETGAPVRGSAASMLAAAFDGRSTDGQRPSYRPPDSADAAVTPRLAADPDAPPLAPSLGARLAATAQREAAEAASEELPSTELDDAPPSVRGVGRDSDEAVAVPNSDSVVEVAPSSMSPPPLSEPALSEPEPSDVTEFVASAPESVRTLPAGDVVEDADSDGEKVSLRDVVVVAKETPPAPRAGTLGTLPPMGRPSAPPPPTIVLAPKSTPPKAGAEAKPKAAKASPASVADAQKPEKPEGTSKAVTWAAVAALVAGAWLGARALGGDAPKTSGTVTPEPSAEPGPRVTAATADPRVGAAPAPSASVEGRATAPSPVTLASGSATPPAAAGNGVGSTASTANAAPPAASSSTASVSSAPAGAEGPTTTAQLLDRAARARRAGSLDKARDLYTQVLRERPGDVEAHSGLGEVARMTGDLPTAKQHYQAALTSSPSFYPALLGLADAAWELGENAEAQKIYARILNMRDNVPERVRERAPSAAPKPEAADPDPN